MSVSAYLGSCVGAFTITPSSTKFSQETRALYCSAPGNVTVEMSNGDTVTINNLAAGVLHPIRVVAVTSATATGLLGFY